MLDFTTPTGCTREGAARRGFRLHTRRFRLHVHRGNDRTEHGLRQHRDDQRKRDDRAD